MPKKITKVTEKRKPGRPFKSKAWRRQTTIYADTDMLEIIDKLTGEGDKKQSRSDFYNKAAAEKLKSMGLWEEESEDGDDK